MSTRICKGCQAEKPVCEFSKGKSHCKKCRSATHTCYCGGSCKNIDKTSHEQTLKHKHYVANGFIPLKKIEYQALQLWKNDNEAIEAIKKTDVFIGQI